MASKFEQYQGKRIVGIDLGTTKSGLSVWQAPGGAVEMVKNAEGSTITPSVVGWDRDHDRWLAGKAAVALGERDPAAVARSLKRCIGRWFTDPAVKQSLREHAFVLEPGSGKNQLEDIFVNFGPDQNGVTQRLSAPDVAAKILTKLREDAAKALGLDKAELAYAVITVPAYFNVLQRDATRLAGIRAGFEVVDIINEPTASALAYRADVLEKGKRRRILVYDLGGGTFDVSILEVEEDDFGFVFNTLVVDGNMRLGGDDIDQALVNWLVEQIEAQTGVTVRSDDLVRRARLRAAAERAKVALSGQESFMVDIDGLRLGPDLPAGTQIVCTREQLNRCAKDVVDRAAAICRRAVEQIARLTWSDIDEIILVGGQTLMPAVQESVAALTGKPPRSLDRPQEVVALGAGVYAHIISQGAQVIQQQLLTNVVALPLGIHLPLETPSFRALIMANTDLPTRSQPPYMVRPARDNETSIEVEILQGKQYNAVSADQCDLIGVVRIENIEPGKSEDRPFSITLEAEEDGILKVRVDDPLGKLDSKVLDITEQRISVYREKAG